MYADALALLSDRLAHSIDQPIVFHRTQSELIRKLGYAVEPHPQSPLAVNGDHQGRLGSLLVLIGQDRLTDRSALKKTKGAHIVQLDVTHDLGYMLRTQIRMRSNHHQLRNALIGR